MTKSAAPKKPSSKPKTKMSPVKKSHHWLRKICITIVAMVLSVDVFHTGNLYYIGKWAACLRQPVAVKTDFSGSEWRTYGKFVHVNPLTAKSPLAVLSLFHGTILFCSEDQAKTQAGSYLNWDTYTIVELAGM